MARQLFLIYNKKKRNYSRRLRSLPGLLGFWSAAVDVFSDTGLTTPVADGGTVGGWKDQSTNSYHVTQTTAANAPLYRASVAALNGHPALEFDSANSRHIFRTLSGTSGVIANLNLYNVFVVFTATVAAPEYFYAEGKSDSATPFATVRHDSGEYEGNYRDDAFAATNPAGGTTAHNGAAHLLTLRRTAANAWAVRADGTEVATSSVSIGATAVDRLCIGALMRNTTALFLNGKIADVLLYSEDNYTLVEPVLANRYGITLP